MSNLVNLFDNCPKLSKSANLVAIDEAQFFDDKIIETCKKLSQHNKHIILAGLDMDYLGEPFGPMPKLIDLANNVISLNAICDICNQKAYHTYRKSKSTTCNHQSKSKSNSKNKNRKPTI